MCGIAGLVALDPRLAIDHDLLDRMTDCLAHRGPDGRGVWHGKGAGLGHRRLAIIDPEGGQQPWVHEDGAAVLVYNGELYNHLDLRRELESEGVKFRSNCDTEVVLHAILSWGIDTALDRFRGMFAFALWEREPRRLTLARDPLGVKPLYWAMRGGLLRFGSEIKAILQDPSFPRSVDAAALTNYLAHYRLSFRGRTLFRNVFMVPAGSLVVWEGKRRSERRFWRMPRIPEAEKIDPGEDAVAEGLRERLMQAVKLRLMSDVPLGAYLSGGIDSSVIVLLMKSLGHKRLKTFSIGFEEENLNEFAYSRLMAKALGVGHRVVTQTESGYFKEFDSLIGIKDAPLSVPNEVPLRFLSRVLKKSITVVLSGEGADELMGGYTNLVLSPHDLLIARALEEGKDFDSVERARIEASLKGLYGETGLRSQKQQFLHLYQWIPRDERDRILGPALRESGAEGEIADFWEEVWAELDGSGLDPCEKVLCILEEIHLSALLLRLDATTMAEGVEGRVPYTDRDLIEWVVSLPVKYKVRWRDDQAENQVRKLTSIEAANRCEITKYMLRLAFAGSIPDEILVRPKQAFPVPLDTWFYGRWHEWARERILTPSMSRFFDLGEMEALLARTRGKSEGMKIWMLANIGIWLDKYFRTGC